MMNYLAKITDFEVFNDKIEGEILKKRIGARIIMFDEQNKIPIMYVSARNFHKLPGGGLEEGETIEQGLIRESLEETGCTIEVVSEVGLIEEIRGKVGLEQFSSCFIGKVIKKGQPSFDKVEVIEKYKIQWATLDEAIEIFKNDKPSDYSAAFILKRELIFLEKAKEILK